MDDAAAAMILLVLVGLVIIIYVIMQGGRRLPSDVGGISKEMDSDFASKTDFEKGVARLKKGCYLESVNYLLAELERADLTDDQRVDCYYYLGIAYRKLGVFRMAIDTLEQAVGFRPDFAEAYIELGRAHEDNDSFELAAEAYGRAVEIDGSLSDAQQGLERVRRRL
ncbi:MAG: hypothetical protein LBD28_01345 [Tannerellaceae bacterium]|nr:hypothetical protein [Tannerellaceae bacterium]